MITCSDCNAKYIDGKICSACAKAFCRTESISECPFCKGKLIEASIEEESFGSMTVQWVAIGPHKSVGLVNLDRIPAFLPRFICNANFKEVTNKLLFFQSKADSYKFVNAFKEKFAINLQDSEYEKRDDKSKYTFLDNPVTKENYVLLNLDAIKTPDQVLPFLLLFLSQVKLQHQALQMRNMDIVKQAFVEALFEFNKHKLGMPFIKMDHEKIEVINRLPMGIAQIYAEYSVLKNLLDQYLSESTDIIEQKLELFFDGIEYEHLGSIPAVWGIFGTYMQLAAVLAVTSENANLSSYVRPKFIKKIEECKKRLNGFQDIIKCIDIILENLSKKEVYSSYELYLNTTAETIKRTFNALEPKYLSLEMVVLFAKSQEYVISIENHESLYTELGSLKEFEELLTRIYRDGNILPELRIVAGQAILDILEAKMRCNCDFQAFLESVTLVQEISRIIEISVPDMKKRMVSNWGYHDACMALFAISQFANMFNEKEIASKLRNMSKSIATKHNLHFVLMEHSFKEFIETHDYEKNFQVHRNFSAIDPPEYEKNQLNMMGYLSKAIFETQSRQTDFDIAEGYALDMLDPNTEFIDEGKLPITSPHNYARAISTNKAYYHFIRVFRHIFNASDTLNESEIKNALLESNELFSSISQDDPLQTFVLKTKIIHGLFIEDVDIIDKNCNKLKEYSSNAPLIRQFIKNVETWCAESKNLAGRRFLMSLNFKIDKYDPWEQVFSKIITDKMKEDLEKYVLANKAIIFVEGIDDISAFEEFARTSGHDKLGFVDSEGFTKMDYYANSKIMKEAGIPTFVIFDGDTDSQSRNVEVKRVLLNEITLSEDHIKTLKKDSIEDYLLVPAAIKRAFPQISKSVEDIGAIFEAKNRKRNKKRVLDQFFKDVGLGKYDHKKTRMIASHMPVEEIDSEISDIFSGFMKLTNSTSRS